MTRMGGQRDLIVLASDKDMEFSMKGLLSRTQSFGIPQLEHDIFVHPEHDPGCFLRGHDFLRPFVKRYRHALVMLDREGCGRVLSRGQLEIELEARLSQSGWNDRAAAMIIDPELESWVWSDSPHVDSVLGWREKEPSLRIWLKTRGLLETEGMKPNRPKEAVREALRFASKSISSSHYLELAQKVSIDHCIDPTFLKLKMTLKRWFSQKA